MCFQPLHLLHIQISLYLILIFVLYNCQNNEPVFYCVASLLSLYMLYLFYFLICYFAVLESSPGPIPFSYHASLCSSWLNRFWLLCILTSLTVLRSNCQVFCRMWLSGDLSDLFHPKTWVINSSKMGHRDRVLFLPHIVSPGHSFTHSVRPFRIKLLIFVLCLAVLLPVLCISHCRSEGQWPTSLRMAFSTVSREVFY